MKQLLSPHRISWLAFALMAAFFWILKLHAIRPGVGDENIYFYLGWRMSEGLFPYRDFIFVHPPMHIYLLGLVAWISGGAFAAMKGTPAVFILLSGGILYELGRTKPLNEFLPGFYWPLLPPLLYYFNYDVLRVSSHWVGVNQALFFILIGLWFHLRHRPYLAGAGYAAALATATYVAPLIVAFFLLSPPWGTSILAAERHRSRQALGSALATFLLLHLPVWILAPGEWWRQTIEFQTRRLPIGSSFTTALRHFLAAEGFLLVATMGFLVLHLARRKHHLRMAWLPMAGFFYLAVFSILERVYIYYLVAAVPFLALGAAWLLREMWETICHGTRSLILRSLGMLLVALIVQPLFYRSIPDVARDPERVVEYEYRPSTGWGPVNAVVSSMFPARRVVGTPAPGIWRYLWHENDYWEGAEKLAGEIARRLPEEATLYGDSTTTPLLAFLSRRRLACDMADTNTMHFLTGMRSMEEELACAREDGLALLVRQPGRGIDSLPRFRQFVDLEGRLWRESRAGRRRVQLCTVKKAADS